jgi:hypothetical protein
MGQFRWDPGHDAPPALGDTARLEDVRAELGEIEAVAREIDDLTALLRARLTPEQFRLAWALRDATERLAVAEELLRARRLVDTMARHLPGSAPAVLAMRRHLLGAHRAIDEAG